MHSVWSLYYDIWNRVNGMDRQEWFVMLLAVMLLGFMCMRGYGSRNSY